MLPPGSGRQLRPPSSVANTPLVYIAERQPTAQPCCGLKKPFRRKAGTNSLALCDQVFAAVAGNQDDALLACV